MSPDLDALLCARYPKLLRNRCNPKSPLNWGISAQDGWFDIVDAGCRALQDAVDAGLTKQPAVLEIKEKFGELGLQVAPVNDATRTIMRDAAIASLTTCAICGKPGVLRSNDGYLAVRCDTDASPGSVPATGDEHFS